MKELSIEEKAKRFDEALAMAKECITYIPDDAVNKYMLNIFPELKGSDDEEVRKAMIDFFKHEREKGVTVLHYGVNIERMIAWLEKQGEQKPQGKSALEAINEEKVDNANKVEPKDYSSIDPHFFKTTDKVEAKFKVGDFIVNDYCSGKVIKITDDAYLLDTGQGIPFSCEHNAHLWNVTKDAKDGDVLCYENEISIYKHDIKNCTKQKTTFGGFVYHCCYDGKRFITDSLYSLTEKDKKNIYPATKEQRDTLERAMTDAGYTFDFEKKELKKLGQSEVTKMSDQEEIAEIPFGAKDSELQEATYYIPKGFHAEIDNDKVVIKKGNKEDESWFKEIELMCLNFSNDTDYREEFFTWLKSIKQRIGG